jgi:hypothetical protein
MAKLRKIEVFEETADLFEARARERGVSVAELLADDEQVWPAWAEEMRAKGEGPWSPENLAEDARRWEDYQRTGEAVPLEEIEAWAKSLGTAHELPRPKARKL